MSTRRCETCGRFVSSRHMRTAFYAYDLKASGLDQGWTGTTVYSLATATRLIERLDCAGCSMQCSRLREAMRGHGTVVGREIPNGWARVTSDSTANDWTLACDLGLFDLEVTP